MPTLSDLRRRTTNIRALPAPAATVDEALVVDERSRLRPAQVVEQKLRRALLWSKPPRDLTYPSPETSR